MPAAAIRYPATALRAFAARLLEQAGLASDRFDRDCRVVHLDQPISRLAQAAERLVPQQQRTLLVRDVDQPAGPTAHVLFKQRQQRPGQRQSISVW